MLSSLTLSPLSLLSCHQHPDILDHGTYRFLTLNLVYSIILNPCYLLSLHSCVSHSCIHCLTVIPLALLISPTNPMFFNSMYQTPVHIGIGQVAILTLNIVLIVYSTSSSL